MTAARWSNLDATMSVAMTGDVARELRAHLDRADGQEDICCVLWRPSTGRDRLTALVVAVVLPEEGERHVHGNASFQTRYLLRAAQLATELGAGVGIIHSHPRGYGWQGMSPDDHEAERSHAAQAAAITNLPLLGMTLGTGDQSTSARLWQRVAPRHYEAQWCDSVRVVDDQLRVTFNDALRPKPQATARQERTVSAWGHDAHQHLTRLRVGVIGVGSVGAVITEALARTGFIDVVLIDFDSVKEHNLDRLLHSSTEDAARGRAKVDLAGEAFRRGATSAGARVETLEYSVTEPEGFARALDCDLLFSCVDRPWPRSALNLIAFAHLIPVVDGGITVRAHANGLRGAEWRAHVVAPGRRCLECLEQYEPSLVQAERNGVLDDSTYIAGLPDDHPLRHNENVFAFSAACAAAELMQMLSFVIAPGGIADVGAQLFHLTTGTVDRDARGCEPHCLYTPGQIGLGDASRLHVTGKHQAAEDARREHARQQPPATEPRRWTTRLAAVVRNIYRLMVRKGN